MRNITPAELAIIVAALQWRCSVYCDEGFHIVWPQRGHHEELDLTFNSLLHAQAHGVERFDVYVGDPVGEGGYYNIVVAIKKDGSHALLEYGEKRGLRYPPRGVTRDMCLRVRQFVQSPWTLGRFVNRHRATFFGSLLLTMAAAGVWTYVLLQWVEENTLLVFLDVNDLGIFALTLLVLIGLMTAAAPYLLLRIVWDWQRDRRRKGELIEELRVLRSIGDPAALV